MANPRVPVITPAIITAPATSASVDFTAVGIMGAVSIRNAGPNQVFMGIDSVPPSAAVQSGVLRLQVNETYENNNINFTVLNFLVGAGNSATVEVVAQRASG